MRIAMTIIACLLITAAADAEIKVGFRQLSTTTPVVVQRGSTSTVNLRSNYTLDGTHSVFFDQPGITMKFLETKSIDAPRRGRGSVGTPFRFECTVPKDQAARVYEIRAATKTAVSSATHLMVSDFPVVEETKSENGNKESAQTVSIPVAISGACEKAEDVDLYKVTGKAGEVVTFQIFAQRVTHAVHSMQAGGGVYLMDPILTLYGPNGQVVAQNDNFYGADSFIALKLPQDGDYMLEVRDARYIGNAKYVYCVEISNQPFAHTTFPFVVQQGKESVVRVLGHNLDDGLLTTVESPANDRLGWKPVRATSSKGGTNPVEVLVSPNPQVVANENLSRESALSVSLPVGLNGHLTSPNQSHHYAFEAKKNQYYLFEVIANQRGLPIDCVIEVHDANGKKLVEGDDGLQTKDAKLYFKAPADGRYVMSVRDLHDRGGERFLYHIKAEPSGPDFELHGEYYYAQLAPGTRMMWFARINRLNGFAEPVEILVDGLPPGVTVEPTKIPAGMNHCGIILSAAKDAKVGASLVRISGRAKVKAYDGSERRLIRQGRITCELQTQGGGQARWPIKTQVVGVTEPLDLLSVETKQSEITLTPGGKAELDVVIKRKDGFKDPVTLAMAFKYFSTTHGAQLPTGVTVSKASKTRLAGDVLEGKIVLEASDKAIPVERLPIAALARVSITFSITTNYASSPVYLTIPTKK